MIVSVNWLKKYTDIELPIDELAQLIGERLVEIEEVVDLGKKYQGLVVAKVVKVYKHPNADKLNVVEIDDGGATDGIARLDSGLIQVVCGAPNVREGMLVAWLPPGSVVPATFSETEPFRLDARELRGVTSNGMLASGKELDINNDHDGIVEIEGGFTPGTPLAEALELDDYLLDIENKSLTHRPDCFGLIGFAREVAAISGKPFKSPDWLLVLEPTLADIETVQGVGEPTVMIDDAGLCPRYEAVVVAGVDSTRKSPLIIQSYLKRVGVKPISAAVDVTNYLMLTSGQPLHAFDYDAFLKIQGEGAAPAVKVRSARSGEKLSLLDGRTIDLIEGDILICAGDTPVALAGAMGGAETEVTDATKNILLESATFNLYNLRTTSMRHGVFTDAVTRFTKGQAAEQTAPVLASAVRMLCDITDGKRASNIVDVYPGKTAEAPIPVSLDAVNKVLGADFAMDEVKKTLIDIECTVTPGTDDILLVLPPYWRADLHIPEDIIEEIGRINGFDSLSPTLPIRPYRAAMPSEFDRFRSSVRETLVRMGSTEVLTYNFVHGKLFADAQQNTKNAYRIVNAISPELQYYRTSLTPSLLSKVNANIRQGYDKFALFEINKVHVKGVMDVAEPELPKEHSRLGLVVVAGDKVAETSYQGSPYYQAKYYLDTLLLRQKIIYRLQPLAESDMSEDVVLQELAAPYEQKRSALVLGSDGKVLGVVGELKKSALKAFKLPSWTACFELYMDSVFASRVEETTYAPLSRYPGTERDICLRVGSDIGYQQVHDIVQSELRKYPYESTLQPVDIYKKSQEDETKQITVRITLNNHESTITADQANEVIDRIAEAAQESIGATRV